jgi:hypothetical protein
MYIVKYILKKYYTRNPTPILRWGQLAWSKHFLLTYQLFIHIM